MSKNIAALIMAIFVLTTSIVNPILATKRMNGQAFEQAKENQVNRDDLSKEGKAEEGEVSKSENLVAEADKENQSMSAISSAEIYQTIVENEAKSNSQNKAFIQAIQETDVTRLDLRKPSGLIEEKAEELLKGTGLEGLGKAFVSAEKQYHVNAYYLMAHAAWESGWGKSKISKEKNNLFGYMAYDHNPGLYARGFKNKSEGIALVAQYVSENYLSESGDYYHGAHLSGMNQNYATDQNWKRGIASVMVLLAEKTEQINRS